MQFVNVNVDDLEKIVLDKCESFVDMGIWPPGEKLSPQRWLSNFFPDEKEHALYLLNAFTYYNLDISISLLRSSIINLSKKFTCGDSCKDIFTNWHKFIANCLFVPVTGEIPNITDSGNLLAGHLRRDLFIEEEQILTLDQLYDSSNESNIRTYQHIIFFDDFVGSGKQFNTMWNDSYVIGGSLQMTVKDHCNYLKLEPHYCGMIMTQYGRENIALKSPQIDLNFSHILQNNISPLHSNSLSWPEHLRSSGPDFILNATRRSGIAENSLRGFHDLGLTIAFSFTIPDATLPIYRLSNSLWQPLMERT